MTQFFKKFPTVSYSNTIAINLLSRVNMSKLAMNNHQAFYDYVMKNHERIDGVSYNYYNNPDYVWLISLTNKVIDPYYDYVLNDDDVNKLIIQKYGSIENAQKTILFFRNNWVNDDSNISIAAYNSYPINIQKYWAPELGYNNAVMGYVRKKEDWVVATNKIQTLIMDTPVEFQIGERLIQGSEIVATVASVSGSTVVAKHISGAIVTGTITGDTSALSGTAVEVNDITNTIPEDEIIYWTAISAFDYENELNHKKRNIKLLDNKFAVDATTQLKNLLK